MFHSTNVFYLDIFASLLTNKILNKKKILSILGVVLFAFALTLSSCGESNADKESVECSADCEKSCCLGCKATEGDKECIKLEDGTMPCCVVSSDDEGGETEDGDTKEGDSVNNVDIEYSEDHNHDHGEDHDH
jgi:hypothetical protein